MVRALFLAIFMVSPAWADPDHKAISDAAVEQRILPVTSTFVEAAEAFSAAAQQCTPEALSALKEGYAALWDAWLPVSVYRFGPVETDGRAMQIAFWPDKKGFTPRALAGLRKAEDPIVDDPAEFATFSVAGRGLLALERLLFDTPEFGAYDCRIIRAIAGDIGRNADLIASEWTSEWAPLIRTAGSADNDVFRAGDEATRTLFTALQGALQEITDLRLARPLGTIDRPRPKRAEAWRSSRALPNIAAVLGEAEAFYQASFRPQISEQAQVELDIAFASVASAMERALEVVPISEAVTSSDRIRIDGLMAAIVGLNDLVTEVLGPELGVTRGFNSRDGD